MKALAIKPLIGAYYYPGWHSCPVRDASFEPGWNEWKLVTACKPCFEGHEQPNIPMWGEQDESEPEIFENKVRTARNFGIDLFVFAHYWSRGKRLLTGAIDKGFSGCMSRDDFRFAVMWANRMPRKVLPVKASERSVLDPARFVHTDPDDFMQFIRHLADNYFHRGNYFRLNGGNYLSIFDTSFFLRQMGMESAARAICLARKWLASEGLGGLHLAAIDPIPEFRPHLRDIGFDSVTHYVCLPEWKGPFLQNYSEAAYARSQEWHEYHRETGLPYHPSISPGWDANPRGADYGEKKPYRYPWWPIVTDRSPESFQEALCRACNYSLASPWQEKLVMISSWNEWSEGHYLEPDRKYGYRWLEAVKNATA